VHENGFFSGPFVCKEWKHNNYIELVKNEQYFDAENVHLSSIYLTMVSPETEIQMFEKGELDFAGSPISTISLDRMEEYKKKNQLHYAPMLGTRFFRINVEDSFLQNRYIRKALALIDHILQGYQKVALQFLPPSPLSYLSDANLDEARELFQKGLEELSLTRENMPKIKILCVGNQQNKLIAQAVQQDWKQALDIDVSIEVNEVKVYYGRLDQKDYQIALGSWIADYNDGENFLEIFKTKTSSNNNTQWESDEYLTLLESAKNLEGEERESKLFHCESILMRDLPIIPLYHFSAHYVKNPRLQGERLSSIGNIDLKWAYLDR
jgi:oligopeptide transport system substrate-binding protein